MDELRRLEQWFQNQTDGEWEHENGVTIGTVDNPGWVVTVSLAGTSLEEQPFEAVTIERTSFDWVQIRVANSEFVGAGGVGNLTEIVRAFNQWAEHSG